jgi:hypothetical protein
VKGVEQHEAARLAEPLQAICAEKDVAFIVNDSIALAKRLKADGVHLGQGDGDVREAREELGREAQIGVTCHASGHLAMEAGEAGADYVAFGSFFPSTGPSPSCSPGGNRSSRSPASPSAASRRKTAGPWSKRGRISSPSAGRCGVVTKRRPCAPSTKRSSGLHRPRHEALKSLSYSCVFCLCSQDGFVSPPSLRRAHG